MFQNEDRSTHCHHLIDNKIYCFLTMNLKSASRP